MREGSSDLAVERSIVFAIAAMLIGANATRAAELPSRNKTPKPAEPVRRCDISGSPGVLAANGVCVRISGYVSTGAHARQIK